MLRRLLSANLPSQSRGERLQNKRRPSAGRTACATLINFVRDPFPQREHPRHGDGSRGLGQPADALDVYIPQGADGLQARLAAPFSAISLVVSMSLLLQGHARSIIAHAMSGGMDALNCDDDRQATALARRAVAALVYNVEDSGWKD